MSAIWDQLISAAGLGVTQEVQETPQPEQATVDGGTIELAFCLLLSIFS